MVTLGYVLSLLRHTSGTGSQDFELQLHKDLTDYILKVISAMRAEWLEDNTDELCLESTIYF